MKIALFAAAMAGVSTAALAQTYQRTDAGIVVTPAQGPQAANVAGVTDQTDLFHTLSRALGAE